VPEDLFDRVIARTLAELPSEFRDLLENVEILIEPEHAEEPDIYVLYEGIPLTERREGTMDMRQPDRVYVFELPLTDDFGHDPALLAAEIRVTLLHELAHHFGIGDDRLGELGWA
jgi:predicted Zn-dependent protease with MMP-like domain